MTVKHTKVDTILGETLLVFDDETLIGLYQPTQPNYPKVDTIGEFVEPDYFSFAVTELKNYFDFKQSLFLTPISAKGTEFQEKVWLALSEIPFGETITYSVLAERIGQPKAVRAVATAVGQNPITVIIPCHRIVSKDGKSVKYSGGATNKELLLNLEKDNS